MVIDQIPEWLERVIWATAFIHGLGIWIICERLNSILRELKR